MQAKKRAAVEWCQRAIEHAREHSANPWTYVLIPHEAIKDNMTLAGLVAQYRCVETTNASLEDG